MTDRPQVLVVTHRFVYPPDRGDRIRTWHIVNELSRHSDVSLACLTDEAIHIADWEVVFNKVKRLAIHPAPKGGAIAGLARSMVNGRSVTSNTFYSAALHRTIHEWSADCPFDAALAVCSSTACYLDDLPIPRRVVDLVDVDSRKWADYAEHSHGLRRMVYRREARKLAHLEQQLAKDYELLVTCEREAKALTDHVPNASVTVARNGAEGHSGIKMAGQCEPTVVFTGVLDYKPNVEGLSWFVKHVWPGVMAKVDGARFDIVGRGAGRSVEKLASAPGVRLVGAVPDTTPYLTGARVAVAPLHIARGVQNKALQAMAAAKPVIATTQVRDGLAINGRCPCIVPESAEHWTRTLAELLNHAPLATSFGIRGRLFIAQHYQWSSTLAPMIARLLPAEPAETMFVPSLSPIRIAA